MSQLFGLQHRRGDGDFDSFLKNQKPVPLILVKNVENGKIITSFDTL